MTINLSQMSEFSIEWSVRLIIDGRVFSTPASRRGMGNYGRSLILKLHEQGYDLAFIGYELTLSEFESELDLFPIISSNYVSLKFNPNSLAEIENFSTVTNQIETAILQLGGNAYLDLTPFISPARIDILIVPIISVIFDFIPLKMREKYLVNDQIRKQYLLSLRSVRNSDLVIAISNNVAMEAENILGIDRRNLVVFYPKVGTGIIQSQESDVLNKISFSGTKEYGLIMGGTHPSKNPEGIAEFCKAVSSKISKGSLVVLFPNAGDIDKFKKFLDPLPAEITFLENLEEFDKDNLVRNAKLFMHFSILEGFGIPIQEAIEMQVPILALDTELNREMKLNSELFDDKSIDILVNKFLIRLILPKLKPRKLSTFTSDEEFEKIVDKISKLEIQYHHKLNLLSPIEPIECGISKLTSEMIDSFIGNEVPIAVYIDDQIFPNQIARRDLRIYSIKSFGLHKTNLPSFFQLGGASWFTGVFKALQTKKTGKRIAIIHDLDISGGLQDICRLGNMKDFYKRVVALENDSTRESGALLNWLAEYFDNVITHLPFSSWPKGVKTYNWEYIPQGRRNPPGATDLFNKTSHLLNLRNNITAGVFGSILRNKRIERSIAALNLVNLDIHLIIAGRCPDLEYLNELRDLSKELHVSDRVHFYISPDEALFYGLMANSSVILAMRDNTIGQISGPILQAFSMGTPILIEKSEYWSELVDNSPLSLPSDPTFEIIAGALTKVFLNDELRKELSIWSANQYQIHSVNQMTMEFMKGIV